MKKYIELLGNFIQKETRISPERARKILELVYTWVHYSGKYNLYRNAESAYKYMTGVVAGNITDTFRKPKESVMVNIFFPCEILHAMDIKPMFPEGLSCYIACTGCQRIFGETAEENDVPETFCSYHKTMLGAEETGVMPGPLLIANTTLACDANQLSFRRMAGDYDVDHIVIDVPRYEDEEAIEYVADQLRAMVPVLEKATGKKLDEKKLKETIERSNKTINLFKEFLDLRRDITLDTTMTGEMCSLISTHIMLGTKEAEKYMESLLKAAKSAPKKETSSKKRIFWVHTLPNWQESMTDIFEKEGKCEIVGTDIATDSLVEMDPEKPFESMAKRVVSSICNGSSQKRISSILENAKKANADGIIVFCHWGCKQTLGFSQMAKQTFEENGLPTLVLDGDGCDSRNVADGQMVTRVNAFIEQLQGF